MPKAPVTPIAADLVPAQTAHSTLLFFTGNGSDKVYQAHLRQRGDAWTLDYNNGPRGGTLQSGSRTEVAVDWATAHKLYAALVRKKLRDGYTENQSGEIYTSSEHAGRVSGEQPQLPTAISDERAEELLHDPRWGLQIKADGENRMLVIEGSSIQGTNRRGLFVDIPTSWKAPISDGRTVMCGEHVGDRFKAFDLIWFMGKDLRALPYRDRFHQLRAITGQTPWIDLLEISYSEDSKVELARAHREAQGEGLVFKLLDAPFEAGRSDASLKVRFWEGATCLVTQINTKRSVGVGLYDTDGTLVDLGNVTIPVNSPIPAIGDLVEVRYLYRHHEGKFEMPTFLGPRTDKVREEATLDQITRVKNRAAGLAEATDDDASDEDLEEAVERPRG